MRRAGFLGLLFLLLSMLPTPLFAIDWAGGSLKTTYDTKVYYETVYGSIDESGLDVNLRTHDNWQYYNTLDLQLNYRLNEYVTLDGNLDVVHTTDKRNYRDSVYERWKINKINLSLSGKSFGIAIGDIDNAVVRSIITPSYEYATRYTYKFDDYYGFFGWCEPTSNLYFVALGGRNRDPEKDTYENSFGFIRAQFDANPYAGYGVSYLHSEITKLYYPEPKTTEYSNDVASFDAGFDLLERRLFIRSIVALSLYERDRRQSDSDTRQGYAALFYIQCRFIRDVLTLDAAYEYIDPMFKTTLGSAPSDRELLSVRLSYTPSSTLSSWILYKYYQNFNTNETPPFYQTYTHELRTEIATFPFSRSSRYFFKNLRLLLHFEYFLEQSNDDPRSTHRETTRANIVLSDNYLDLLASLQYNWEYVDNLLPDTEDVMKNVITVSLDWDKTIHDFTLIPHVSYSIVLIDRTRENPDFSLFDITQNTSASLTITYIPWGTSLSIKYESILDVLGDGNDTRRSITNVSLRHPLIRKNRIDSYVEIGYENNDYWSMDSEKRNGYDRYTISFMLAF